MPLHEAVYGRDGYPSAEATLMQKETHARVWQAVAALEPRPAMAVELYYRRQMPVHEVAAVLGCPAGTVKTLLHRAREALRPALRSEALP